MTHQRLKELKKKLYQLFQECDEDRNGVIDTEEFKQVMFKVLPKTTDETVMAEIFRTFGLDNNGVINYHQLLNRPEFETFLQKVSTDKGFSYTVTKAPLDYEHNALEIIVESKSEKNGQKITKPTGSELDLWKEEKQVLLQDNLTLKVELERVKLQHGNEESKQLQSVLPPDNNATNNSNQLTRNSNSVVNNDNKQQPRKEEKKLGTEPRSRPSKGKKSILGKALEIDHNDLREPLLGEEYADLDTDKDNDKELDKGACGCLKFW